MKLKVSLSALVVALISMAVVSLLIMVCLVELNNIVHGVLNDFGLIFSYRWAMPYWVNSGITFGLSWFNIVAAIVLVHYVFRRRAALKSQGEERAESMEASSECSGEENGKLVQLQIVDPCFTPSPQIEHYDVRRPKEVVDSQC